MTAEDFGNDDLEHIERAGEANLPQGLEAESANHERAHVRHP